MVIRWHNFVPNRTDDLPLNERTFAATSSYKKAAVTSAHSLSTGEKQLNTTMKESETWMNVKRTENNIHRIIYINLRRIISKIYQD